MIPDFDDEDETPTCSVSGDSGMPPYSFVVDTNVGGTRRGNATSALKRDREREGRCGECGIQTHGIRIDPSHVLPLKVPLTIENEVYRGRCLLCFPLNPNRTHQPPSNVQGSSPANSFSVFVADVNANSGSTSIPSESHSRLGPLSASYGYMGSDESTEIVDMLYIMRQHPHSEAIQEWGCEGLWIHSWEDETSAAIGRIGGISRILDAMSLFPHNEHLQHCACEALQNLAVNSYNRNAIVDYGGAALIVQAMMRHFDSLDIQQCGSVALTSLAASPELHDDIIRAGGAHAIIHAARKYADGDSIRSGAFLAVAMQALHALNVDPCRYILSDVHQIGY